MHITDITVALSQKVIDTIYTDWKHEGHIEVEHGENFYCTIDDRLYKVTVEEVEKVE